MKKNFKIKTSSQFLQSDFPENLILTKKFPKKYKQLLNDKRIFFTRIKKRVKNIENSLFQMYKQDVEKKIHNRVRFLFSLEQLHNDILKKQSQYITVSDFLLKLKEKKKVSLLYGVVSKKFFEKAYRQAKHSQGKTSENLLLQFESRLDVLLFRICFCKNLVTAKHYIAHNVVYVNGKTINIPSYQVKAGDIISITPLKKNQVSINLLSHLKSFVLKRKSKSLFSFKALERYWKKSQNSNILEYKLYYLLTKSKKYSFQKGYKNLQKFKLLESLVKIRYLHKILEKLSNNLSINSSILKKYIFLKYKQAFFKKRSRSQILNGMKISSLKPIHVEVSYKLLTAIVLFLPQKISFPTLVNTDLLIRALSK